MKRRIQLVIDKGDQAPDARTKAPSDTIRVLEKAGYKPWYIAVDPALSHYKKLIQLCWRLLIFCLRIPQCTELFVQYPLTNLFWVFLPVLRLKQVQITMLVHDVESYRATGIMNPKETEKLNCATHLVLPSKAMEDLLRSTGLKVQNVHYHYLWPYLLPPDYKMGTLPTLGKPLQVIFAGNLSKSTFLSHFPRLQNSTYQIRLYGGGYSPDMALDGFVSYCSSFRPNSPLIEGDWGIVWDGYSLEACAGEAGEYLRISAPHKLSLYLSVGIPVIVWKEATIAEFVESNHLGIAVSNLYEVEARLKEMSEAEYASIKADVHCMAMKIRSGELFVDCLPL